MFNYQILKTSQSVQYDWRKHLNNTKWILTLMMVLYHIYVPSNVSGPYQYVYSYIKNLGDCVVPAFAIISGYLFFYDLKRYAGWEKLFNKMKRRVWTLVIPYFLWNILHTVIWQVKSGDVSLLALQKINWFDMVILGSASPHFWYILMLIFWAIFSPVLLFVFRKKWLTVIFLVVQILLIVLLGDKFQDSHMTYLVYTWGGILGYYFGDELVKWISFLNKKPIALCVGIVVYIAFRLLYMNSEIQQITSFCYLVRAVLLILLLMNMPEGWIGRHTRYAYSFWLFAIHLYLDSFFIGVYCYRVPVYLIQPCVWLTTIVFGLVVGIFIKMFFCSLFDLLTGKRTYGG